MPEDILPGCAPGQEAEVLGASLELTAPHARSGATLEVSVGHRA